MAENDAKAVLGYIADLWGFDVELRGVNGDDEVRYSYELGSTAKAAALVA